MGIETMPNSGKMVFVKHIQKMIFASVVSGKTQEKINGLREQLVFYQSRIMESDKDIELARGLMRQTFIEQQKTYILEVERKKLELLLAESDKEKRERYIKRLACLIEIFHSTPENIDDNYQNYSEALKDEVKKELEYKIGILKQKRNIERNHKVQSISDDQNDISSEISRLVEDLGAVVTRFREINGSNEVFLDIIKSSDAKMLYELNSLPLFEKFYDMFELRTMKIKK